jgi:carbamoyl-phosphate synthase large subunit
MAFIKSQIASGLILPRSGKIFISVNDRDKPWIVGSASTLHELGFELVATEGTAAYLAERGIPSKVVRKVYEGRPNVIDMIKNKEIDMVINTSSGKLTVQDSSSLRHTVILYGLPYTTTLAGTKAMAQALKELKGKGLDVCSLQEYHQNGCRDRGDFG